VHRSHAVALPSSLKTLSRIIADYHVSDDLASFILALVTFSLIFANHLFFHKLGSILDGPQFDVPQRVLHWSFFWSCVFVRDHNDHGKAWEELPAGTSARVCMLLPNNRESCIKLGRSWWKRALWFVLLSKTLSVVSCRIFLATVAGVCAVSLDVLIRNRMCRWRHESYYTSNRLARQVSAG
jgi:hypothetical protein